MLKERVIEFLKTHPDEFQMVDFIIPSLPNAALMELHLASVILKLSGYPLQLNENNEDPRLPRNAPEVQEQWLTYERVYGQTAEDYIAIPALARQLWAAENGTQEAQFLPFYDVPPEGELPARYWDDAVHVDAQMVIRALIDDPKDTVHELNEYAPEDE